MNNKKILLKIYDRLYKHFGPRHWWPADTPFEVIIGAILTQNTSWKNVEKAILSLKKRDLLTPGALRKIGLRQLGSAIKSAGFYNIKAERIKSFVNFLFIRYNCSVKAMFSRPLPVLRKELLKIKGIGPETADSILLYAAGKPIFVIDAYTKRIFSRHKLIKKDVPYDRFQDLFMKNLPRKASLFNEYHALLVETAKMFCKSKPLCKDCPLTKVRR